MNQETDARERLHDLLQDFDTAMLVTRGTSGSPHARPMALAKLEENGDAYLVTSIDSPKVDEIRDYPQATLTFQASAEYASLTGHISLVRDRALIHKLWKEPWKAWFPRGKDDPSIMLLKFEADAGEYWDNAGVQGLKYVYSAAKAYARGERPQTDKDQHGRVRL